MPQTLVLAKSITEANQYAKAVGLQRFTYRAVRNAGSIRGVRHAEVHLLSSFLRRLDRHAIMGALRWARTLDVYFVDFVDGKIIDGTEDPRGDLTDQDLEVAYRYNAIRDAASEAADDPTTDDHGPEEQSAATGETEQSEDAAPAEKPQPKPRKQSPAKKAAAARKPAPVADDLFG
jgi:hypothetical protein